MEKWQTLAEHLDNTSRLAGKFAAAFSEREWGIWLGLLHDIGKYSNKFQERLRDSRLRVDHSTAGAKEILAQIIAHAGHSTTGKIYTEYLARLAAGILAGHHGGLPNLGGDFDKRCRNYAVDYSGWHAELVLPRGLPPFSPVPVRHLDLLRYYLAFRARMLFSCLVDADRLDAEAFSSPEKSGRRERYPSIQEIHDAFMKYMAGKTDPNAPPDSVNAVRNLVLDDALLAADKNPGLFRLTVPTGGGKTLSSFAFALRHAFRHEKRRVIYVIPYTSIIEQTADVFRSALGASLSEAIIEHHSNYTPPVSVGTDAENPDETGLPAWENWDAPVIVTTAVQFFESLHAANASAVRKIHNIANSVVVLDETQTLPPPLLRPCVKALDELARFYRVSVVLCTATQPEFNVSSWLPEGLEEREVREINTDIPGTFGRLRRVVIKREGTLDSAVLTRSILSHEKALCIVNTRAHAREVFDRLAEGADGETGIWHLSARMHPQHRRVVIRRVRESLAAPGRCLAVSTQLIEAGVDLDFPVVYRCVAGLDSIAQAAGRCNREGKLPTGSVHVFASASHPPLDETDAALAQSILSSPENADRDPLAPDVMRQYFGKRQFLRRKEGLDRKGVLEHIFRLCPHVDFPRIEKDFRFVDDEGRSVIVPIEIDESGRNAVATGQAAVDELVGALRESLSAGIVPRTLLRRLQAFTVSLRERDFERLAAAGSVECLGRDGAFPLLINTDLYSTKTGIVTDDPVSMRSESLILQ